MRLPPLPLTIILLAFAVSLPAVEDPGDAELLLEKAIFLEAIRGKPAEALQLYRRIQDGAQKENLGDQTMARALLGEATCLDATGKDQLAREKFQAIIDRYPLQEEIRDIAHGYIRSRLWDTPASYMPEEMLFYAEMVKPGEELIRLSKAIRSTPFENPIDASRTLAADPEGAAAALEESSKSPAGWISAFLNKSLFRELSKMGGIAIGIPAVIIVMGIRILTEYERGVLFRFGRFTQVKQAGLRWIIPGVDRMTRISLREIVMDVPAQEVITRDNVA